MRQYLIWLIFLALVASCTFRFNTLTKSDSKGLFIVDLRALERGDNSPVYRTPPSETNSKLTNFHIVNPSALYRLKHLKDATEYTYIGTYQDYHLGISYDGKELTHSSKPIFFIAIGLDKCLVENIRSVKAEMALEFYRPILASLGKCQVRKKTLKP